MTTAGLASGAGGRPRVIPVDERQCTTSYKSVGMGGYKPVFIVPQPFSVDETLRKAGPASDEETERFVAAIYADRRQAADDSRRNEPNSRHTDVACYIFNWRTLAQHT